MWSYLTQIAPDEQERVDLVRRLEIHILGDEVALEKTISDSLAPLYEEPREPILKDLCTYFSTIGSDTPVDAAQLEERVLIQHRGIRLPTPRSVVATREQFLSHIVEHARTRFPLAGALQAVALKDISVSQLGLAAPCLANQDDRPVCTAREHYRLGANVRLRRASSVGREWFGESVPRRARGSRRTSAP